MTGSRVVALGHYQPDRGLTNDELAAMVDTSDEWIVSRVGIRTRRIAGAVVRLRWRPFVRRPDHPVPVRP
jgi:3-oxoacyl-[acyl-carrier-protein] synthase III